MKAQVIHYKCCSGQFAGHVEPECYSSPEWLKDVLKYSKKGFKVSIVELGNGRMFDHSEGCPNAGTNNIELPKINPQLSLMI